MKVATVRRFGVIALFVAMTPLSACSGDPSPSPSEKAQVQHVAARTQAHKDEIQQQETAKKVNRAMVHAKADADHERQRKAKAGKAARVRKAPQYGYQCLPGAEKDYTVCAGHKAWIDGQVVYDRCIKAGRTWDVAAQRCGAMDPDAGPEGDGHGNP